MLLHCKSASSGREVHEESGVAAYSIAIDRANAAQGCVPLVRFSLQPKKAASGVFSFPERALEKGFLWSRALFDGFISQRYSRFERLLRFQQCQESIVTQTQFVKEPENLPMITKMLVAKEFGRMPSSVPPHCPSFH